MTSEANSVAKSGQESVVIASFDSYHHAEHMLASLGRAFRTKARKGGVTAVLVTGNPDGSLKVTESRVLSAGDFVSTLIRVSLAWTVGFIAIPIPSGVGIREAVLATILHGIFPASVIIAASVYYRLVCVATEGVLAAIASHRVRPSRLAAVADDVSDDE